MDDAPPNPPLGAPNAGRGGALDALARYLEYLSTPPPSPFRAADGQMTDAARRGRAIFDAAGCGACHARPRYTDSEVDRDVRHDVGTLRPSSGQRLGEPLDGLDTPTLLGLWDGAPYLHDGRAATLTEVLVQHNPDDRHGRTSDLDDAAIEDLVAYLLELDGRPEEAAAVLDAGVPDVGAPDAGSGETGGGCAVSRGESGWWLALLPLAAAWGRRRRRRR